MIVTITSRFGHPWAQLWHDHGRNKYRMATRVLKYGIEAILKRYLDSDFEEFIGFPSVMARFKKDSLEAMLATIYTLEHSYGFEVHGPDFRSEEWKDAFEKTWRPA